MEFGEKVSVEGEGARGHLRAYYLPLWLILGMMTLFFVPEFRGMMDPVRPTSFGVDFYHFWAVGHAKERNAAPLGSPWPDASRYERVLARSAELSADPLQQAAQRHRHELDLTSTPWTYAVFAPAPQIYETALRFFRVVGLLLFLSATILLGYRWYGTGLGGLILALLLCLFFIPLRTDLRVGNTGLVVFSLLAGGVLLLEEARQRASSRILIQALALAFVLFGVLLKPTWWWALVGVGVHLWSTREKEKWRLQWLGLGLMMGFVLLLPILYFADYGIWFTWLNSVILQAGSRLDYAIHDGNFSSLKLMARAMDAHWRFAVIPTLILMICPLFRYRHAPSEVLGRFESPGFSLSVGITASLAFSPLCWVHYFLLLILPALSLARSRRWWAVGIGLGSLVLAAGWVDHGLAPYAWGREVIPWLFGLSWLPLWWALWTSNQANNERGIDGIS